MNFILGKKIEMTQLYNNEGEVVPATMIQAGPCKITQVKTAEKDSYSAVQIGFGKKKNLSKALKNHLKDLENYRYLKEFQLENQEIKKIKRGDEIKVNTFSKGDKVKIIGVSKGKGFQGVVKRHGFHGQQKTHGNKDQERMPGSAGPTEPARVFKGKKMPGHMGDDRITVKNLEIIKIDEEKNILYIKGAVPGARTGLVMISGKGELKVNTVNLVNQVNSEKKEDEKEIEKGEKRKEEYVKCKS